MSTPGLSLSLKKWVTLGDKKLQEASPKPISSASIYGALARPWDLFVHKFPHGGYSLLWLFTVSQTSLPLIQRFQPP